MAAGPVDVIVAGAGPVGLLAAAELARRGVTVRIIDRLTAPTTESRAVGVQGRSLDMFERIGLADRLIDTGVKTVAFQLYSGRVPLARFSLGINDVAFPFMLTTAQTETERILGDHLRSTGVVVERSVDVAGLSQDNETVHVQLARDDGSVEDARASWVIGADGAGSTVRRLVGAELQGGFELWHWIVSDVEADHHLAPERTHMFLSDDGPVVAIPMRDKRIRFLAQITKPEGPAPTAAQLQLILDRRIGGVRLRGLHWLAYFQIHLAQVSQYRWGRVFLAGDAAHIHSPAGGQGMNTGMQDAFNLAWKLAAVIDGRGGPVLLDSYDAERRPVAQQIIQFTGDTTKSWQLTGVRRLIRDTELAISSRVGIIKRKVVSTLGEVNVGYQDGPLAVGTSPPKATVAAGQHFPYINDELIDKQLRSALGPTNLGHTVVTVAPSGQPSDPTTDGDLQILVSTGQGTVGGYNCLVVDHDGLVADRLGLKSGGRVVIRPDGYIGSITGPDDDAPISEYFRRVSR
jgi:2-polyprenyl-6-methoxyphenol hydroxylase-like FAD-dependent oxidoreductase